MKNMLFNESDRQKLEMSVSQIAIGSERTNESQNVLEQDGDKSVKNMEVEVELRNFGVHRNKPANTPILDS